MAAEQHAQLAVCSRLLLGLLLQLGLLLLMCTLQQMSVMM